MKIINKLFALALCIVGLSGCQQGLVYDEVPESVYNDVSLTANLCKVEARELFTKKVWQVNYNGGKGQWVENMILTVNIGSTYQTGADYTNGTGADVTIMGKVVKPGETINVKNTMTIVDDASAPDGKLYVLNIFAKAKVEYKTPNKGHQFVESAFAGDAVKPIFVDAKDGMAEKIILPADQKKLVVALLLANSSASSVESIDGAPGLGMPNDFSAPRRYLVVNTTKRPDGAPAASRLYEIRIQLL